jgi:hypothetical protein
MEEINSYLKDLEGKVKLEVFNLLNEVKTSRNEIAYKNLNDIYSIPELKDANIKITYYPCLQIEYLKPPHPYKCKIFTSEFRLPPNEVVIKIRYNSIIDPERNGGGQQCKCKILTNYGRMFNTQLSYYSCGNHGYGESWRYYKRLENNVEIECDGIGYTGRATIKIIELEPLPYKLPVWCLDSFNSIDSENQTQLQGVCRDVFNIIGRWREHVTETINVDSEKMLQQIKEQTETISELTEQIEKLQQIKDRQKTSIEILDKRIEIFESKEKFHSKNEGYIEEFNKVIVDFFSETEHKKMYLHDGDNRIEGLKDFFEDHSFLYKDEYHTYKTHKKEFLEYIQYNELKRKFK